MKKSLYIRFCYKALGLLFLIMPYFLSATSQAGTPSHKADFGSSNPVDLTVNSFSSAFAIYNQIIDPSDTSIISFVGSSQYTLNNFFSRNSKRNFISGYAMAAPPTIVCPGNIVSNTDPGFCRALITGLAATINDPDGDITTLTWTMTGATNASSPINGINNILGSYTFNKGITNVTYRVTDGMASTVACSFSVTINDKEVPVIVCPLDQNITIPSCAVLTDPISFSLLSVSDNCGILNFSSNAPVQFPVGITPVIYTANDINTNSAQCTQIVTVTSDPPITGAITSQTNVACVGTATGSVTVSGNGGTSPYEYNINGGTFQASGTFNNLIAGTYTIVVRDLNNCTSTVPVTITQSPTILTASVTSITNVQCSGQANGSATVTANGGTSPYTYSWNTVPVQTAATAINLTLGSYTVTVRDITGCIVTANVTITEPTPLQVAISKTDVSCFGDSTGTATALASGGTPPYNYAWITTPVQTTATVTNLPAGTYTVAVFDSPGCFIPAFVTIAEPASKLIASVTSVVNVVCTGTNTGSITVSGSGGTAPIQYNINGGTFQVSGTFNFLFAGTYTIIARDANNCVVNLSAIITEPVNALTTTITSQTNILCSGQANGSATVTATWGTAPYTYSWNSAPVQTAATAINLTARNYIVTVTDAAGCIKTANVTITEPAPLIVSISKTDVACSADSTGTATALASGGTPPYTYAWLTDPIQTTATVTNLPAGTYTVAVFDSLNCFKPAFVTIAEPASKLLASVTNQINVVCAGSSTGSITVTGSGGIPPYQYSINGAALQASGTFSNLAAGAYTISVTDVNNCLVDVPATITEPANALSASVTSQVYVSCAGQATGSATVTASGGTSPYTYSWNTVPVQAGSTAVNLSAGNYTVTITDVAGCIISANVTITEPAPLTVTISKTDVSCFGDSSGTATATASGGTPPYNYAWITTPVQTTATVTNLPAGTYTVAVFDSLGCFIPAFVTIDEPVQLIATITDQVNVACGGNTGSLTVAGSGGIPPYQYSINGGALQASGTFISLSAGVYTITTQDANNCTYDVTATITEPVNALQASVTAQTNVLCFGEAAGSATVTATGGTAPYTYSWNTVPAQTTATISNLVAGNYIVTSTDNTGCIVTDTAFITEPSEALSGTITNQVNYDCATGINGSVTVAGKGGIPGYQYSLDGSPYQISGIFTNLAAGNYTINVQDANNCEAPLPVEILLSGLVLAADDNTSSMEDIVLNGNVMVNDQVACNLPITVTSNTSPQHGSVIVNADGTYTYTPSQNYNGTDSFTYTLTDNAGGTSTATVFITMDPANDPPVTLNDNVSVIYNLPATNNLLLNGHNDPDGTALTVNTIPVIDPANGTFVIAADGTFTYTPNLDYIGNDMVVVSICDAGIPLPSACTSDTIFIEVLPPNTPPVTFNENITVCQDGSFTGTVANGGTVFNGDTDPENNLPLSLNIIPVKDAKHGVFSITDAVAGTFNYIPDNAYTGSDYAVVSICDAGIPVECRNDTIFIEVAMSAIVNAGPDERTCAGSAITISLASASDYSTLVWSVSPISAGTITNSETLSPTFTPATGFTGTATLILSAKGNGTCVDVEVSDGMDITVNSALIADAGIDQTILPGKATILSGSASDGSGFYAWNWQPAALLLNPSDEDPFTVPLNSTTTFTLSVLDIITGCSDNDTVEIVTDNTINTIVATDDHDSTLINSSGNINVLENDLNPDNHLLTISICGSPMHGLVVINSDNTITYTPYSDFEGNDEFCYRICSDIDPMICSSAQVFINVKQPSLNDLYAYNGISPNGDGNNDKWKIRGIEKYPDNTVLIFNRWGDKLREFANYNNTVNSWDGKNEKGDLVPDGTYFYILDVKNVGVLKGWIYIRGK